MRRKKIKNFKDALGFLTEAIENGYDYDLCIHRVSMQLPNIDNVKTEKIKKLMKEHDWNEDQDYLKFSIGLENIIILS